jgi:RHS repeat-associated protein
MYAGDWGYRNDGDAGLMHVGARYYDAQVGRFITRDTVLSEHPYLYCEHEPVNGVDPSGHLVANVSAGATGVFLIGAGWADAGLYLDFRGWNPGNWHIGVGGHVGGGIGVGLFGGVGAQVGWGPGHMATGSDDGYGWGIGAGFGPGAGLSGNGPDVHSQIPHSFSVPPMPGASFGIGGYSCRYTGMIIDMGSLRSIYDNWWRSL